MPRAFVITLVCDDCLGKQDFNEAALRLAVNSQSVSILQVEEMTPLAAAQRTGTPVPMNQSWGSWARSWLGYKK